MMLRLRRTALVRHQVRKYVRDPQQAVEEASTVRGYRLAQQPVSYTHLTLPTTPYV